LSDEPRYETFFEEGSIWKLLRGEDAYTMVDTYHVLRRVFGYKRHYANYGYWKDGIDTHEPGRELALHMGRALGLKKGQRLLEAGSGLGQAAVDICEHFELAGVTGLNPCTPQVNFANALSEWSGTGERVQHRVADACAEVETFPPGHFDHAMAQECIGHFPDPMRFLRGVHTMLPSGGRFAFTLVTSPKPPSRSVAAAQKLFFGVVPESGDHWAELITKAGFNVVQKDDITDIVFTPLFKYIRRTLKDDPKALQFQGPLGRIGMRALLTRSEAGVRTGTMGYELIVGEVP
jgi:cyclopropane fatty-acyl-phospholipid synthase-like methyltransferase